MFITSENFPYYLGKGEDSIAISNKVLTLEPNNRDALMNKADPLFVLGRYDDAVGVYDQILSLDATDTYAQQGKNSVLNKISGQDQSGPESAYAPPIRSSDNGKNQSK